jgi:DNA-binding CsgD family transcriptional regulator
MFVLLQTCCFCFSQNSAAPIKEWVKKLSAKNDDEYTIYTEVQNELNKKDSLSVMNVLNDLEDHTTHSDHFFNARFFALKANQLFRINSSRKASALSQICENSLKEAYESGDDHLILFSSWAYGGLMGTLSEIELSATYLLKAVETNEQLEKKYFSATLWLSLGETLFHTREYEKCIYYIQKGLDNWKDTAAIADYHRIRLCNTIGQAYQQLGKLDSAMISYKRSMVYVDKHGEVTWQAINSGFIGQIYFLKKDYQKAKKYLQADYNINKNNEGNIAANTLQWLSRISLIEGKEDSALLLAREALQFSQKTGQISMQQLNYLQHIYYTTADVYRAIGNNDSFYHYFQLYSSLHDSLERVATLSSIKMTQARIENESNHHAIQNLQKEKRAEEQKRNFIIAVIILCSIIAFSYVNRLRLKHRLTEQIAVQQKNAAEAEMESAREQLKLFTQNLIEKTSLVEKLEGQLNNHTLSIEQQDLITSLSSHTILTEDDWEKFKSLFEKIYPGFFIKLKTSVGDITLSELRMAALVKLHLTTRQIAAILGISPNSVNKTKQRLRQRLHVDTEKNIEDVIAEI